MALKKIKKEIRIIGFDDSPFNKKQKKVLIVGTIYRGGNYMDGLLSCEVNVDGKDSTDKLISIIKKTRHLDQLQCIMLDGIAFGGFNVVDINRLNKKTKLPVIVIIRKKPDLKKIKKVLSYLKQPSKFKLMQMAGKIHKVNNIYIQIAGIDLNSAKKIVKLSTNHSNIPEPIRVAHLISSGIAVGESHGRA